MTPQTLWTVWNFEPALIVPLEVTTMVYLLGLRNAWDHAGLGRSIPVRSCVFFLGAMLALVAALVSPLDALSGVLFSAHMVQHLILILVAAPLLVVSDIPLALFWALPRGWAPALGRRWVRAKPLGRAWQAISHPIAAWFWFALALWLWHTAALFEAALRNDAIHAGEHVVFLVTAGLFWRVLLRRTGPRYLQYGQAIPYLFLTVLHSGLFGALMTFTTQPWYTYYATRTALLGLTPLQDQQLAGLIMWIPGGLVFTLLTIGYFAAWLHALDQRRVPTPPPNPVPL